MRFTYQSAVLAAALFSIAAAMALADPLPSWNDTAPKKAIVEFVEKVTKEGSSDFVKPEQRIATFDNDGTLWVEQPIYTQATFAIDEVIAKAPQHPEWRETEPFKSILAHGQDSNWILTREGKPFFVMFRIYGPEKGAVDGSWMLNDIEKVNNTRNVERKP